MVAVPAVALAATDTKLPAIVVSALGVVISVKLVLEVTVIVELSVRNSVPVSWDISNLPDAPIALSVVPDEVPLGEGAAVMVRLVAVAIVMATLATTVS